MIYQTILFTLTSLALSAPFKKGGDRGCPGGNGGDVCSAYDFSCVQDSVKYSGDSVCFDVSCVKGSALSFVTWSFPSPNGSCEMCESKNKVESVTEVCVPLSEFNFGSD